MYMLLFDKHAVHDVQTSPLQSKHLPLHLLWLSR